jgi:hypothetical protein
MPAMSAAQPKRGSGSFSLTKPEISGVDARAEFHGFRNRGDYLRALVRADLKLGMVRVSDNADGKDILLPTEPQWSQWSDKKQVAEWQKRNAIGRIVYAEAVGSTSYDHILHSRINPEVNES